MSKQATEKEKKIIWREFRTFIARGNVIDLAVAVAIGAAFGKIVTALVEGIIMPPIGLILAKIDFSGLFYVLDKSKGIPVSLEEAKAKAIPVIAYGSLLNDVIGFLIIALVIFMMLKAINKIKGEEPKAAAAAPTAQEILLAEIRDILRSRN